MKKKDKKNLLKQSYLSLLVLLLLLGITYAVFSYLKLGDKTNTVKTGTLVIDIDDSMGPAIHVENAYPVTDAVGRSSEPYKFNVTNKGTVDANYELRLINDLEAMKQCGCDKKNTLAKSIKYEYKKTKDSTSTLSDIRFLSKTNDWNSTVLESGFIRAKETIRYELRLWIDEDTESTEANKHLHAKVEVEAVQYTDQVNNE